MRFCLKHQLKRNSINRRLALLKIHPPGHGGIHGAERRGKTGQIPVAGIACQRHRVLAHVHGLTPQHREKPLGLFRRGHGKAVFGALLPLTESFQRHLPVASRRRPSAGTGKQVALSQARPGPVVFGSVAGIIKHSRAKDHRSNQPSDQSRNRYSAYHNRTPMKPARHYEVFPSQGKGQGKGF